MVSEELVNRLRERAKTLWQWAGRADCTTGPSATTEQWRIDGDLHDDAATEIDRLARELEATRAALRIAQTTAANLHDTIRLRDRELEEAREIIRDLVDDEDAGLVWLGRRLVCAYCTADGLYSVAHAADCPINRARHAIAALRPEAQGGEADALDLIRWAEARAVALEPVAGNIMPPGTYACYVGDDDDPYMGPGILGAIRAARRSEGGGA